MKVFFYGSAAAALAGLAAGAAIRAPIAPSSSYGQQQLISHPQARTPSAFDSWMPTEGAPPAYVAQASWAPPGRDEPAWHEPKAQPAPYPAASVDLPPPERLGWRDRGYEPAPPPYRPPPAYDQGWSAYEPAPYGGGYR